MRIEVEPVLIREVGQMKHTHLQARGNTLGQVLFQGFTRLLRIRKFLPFYLYPQAFGHTAEDNAQLGPVADGRGMVHFQKGDIHKKNA
ncbi:hypothetical protein D9M69_683460 [compost metagenome]